MSEEFYQLKVIIIGQPTVGKTCLVQRITKNTFNVEYKTTLGVDFASKTQTFSFEGKQIQLCFQLWDIAGQDYYSKLVHVYYRNSMGCLLVCDLSSETVLKDIRLWYEEVKAKVMIQNTQQQIPIVLVCNKCDLQRSVNKWEEEGFQQELQKLHFDAIVKTSALKGDGVGELLQKLGEIILRVMRDNGLLNYKKDKNVILMDQEDQGKEPGKSLAVASKHSRNDGRCC